MRQPLRYQIKIPMLGLMLTALIGVSVLNAYLAADRMAMMLAQSTETCKTP